MVVILGCSSITGVTTPGAGPSALPVMGRGPEGERVMVDGSTQETYLLILNSFPSRESIQMIQYFLI